MICLKKKPETESGIQNELLVQTGIHNSGRIWAYLAKGCNFAIIEIFIWIMRKKKNEKK